MQSTYIHQLLLTSITITVQFIQHLTMFKILIIKFYNKLLAQTMANLLKSSLTFKWMP